MQEHAQTERRAAENQSLFRQVNEQIEALNAAFDAFTPHGSWSCECANTSCLERLEMTLAEYEALRRQSNRFAVAPGEDHVWQDVENVVHRTERYWVVEKEGAAGERAIELDGRAATDRT